MIKLIKKFIVKRQIKNRIKTRFNYSKHTSNYYKCKFL